MLTQTYTRGSDRAANRAVNNFTRFLSKAAAHKEQVLSLDGSEKDLDPRDGFVQLDDENSRAAGPNFFQSDTFTVRTEGANSTVRVESEKERITRHYEFNSNTQTLSAKAFTDSESEHDVANNTFVNTLAENQVAGDPFGRFMLRQITAVREQAREIWEENGNHNDENWSPWVFEGPMVYSLKRQGLESARVKKVFGKMSGHIRQESDILSSFKLSHSLASGEQGLPKDDAWVKTRFPNQERTVDWNTESKTMTVTRVYQDPTPVLMGMFE